ncbi:hypothetical protein [Actinomadura chokoriensis]|uniref:hypothetical protein n=1 Tax=Actinomadura chokoriensis TaxID=454156 RepID=UPI0031F82685
MRINRSASPVQKSFPTLLMGGAGSLSGLAATGGPDALWWAASALVLLAVVLAVSELILGHRRAIRETERGAARDAAAALPAQAAAARPITPSEAADLLDAQSRHEAVVTGLAVGADPAELAKLVRALRAPAQPPARPRHAGSALRRATRHDPK